MIRIVNAFAIAVMGLSLWAMRTVSKMGAQPRLILFGIIVFLFVQHHI